MKKALFIIVIILLLIIFQTSLLAPWFSDYNYPGTLIVLVVAITAVLGFLRVWPWIILAGVVTDLFSYSRIGVHVIIFILAAYLISFVSRRFSIGGRGLGISLIFLLIPLVTLIDYWGFLFLTGMFDWGIISLGKILGSLFPTAIFNIILFFVFFLIINKMEKHSLVREYRVRMT